MSSNNRARRGFTLIELLIVIAIILIIAGIAIPSYNNARMYAQETAARSTITTLHTAEAQYFSQFGKFAETLAQLGPPSSGASGPGAADLISGDLASGAKGGYIYVLAATKDGYTINANPKLFNQTGRHTYYSDQTLVIRENNTAEPATAQSTEVK
jgi:type IV pilus assembly protein PilA